MSEVTQLLLAIENGDQDAQERLLPLVYDNLKQIARGYMSRERPDHTLQATALLHEAYLKLLGDAPSRQWNGRAHFYAAAAEAMRRILIDHARRRAAIRHGGGQNHVAWHDEIPVVTAPCDNLDDLLSLDEALHRLEAESPEKATLVKLLYFGGLKLEEAAEALGTSRTSAYRQWQYARAWLLDALKETEP